MIDYSPLHETLIEQDRVISEMRDTILNSRTIAKINKNQPINISTIEKICLYLDVPIEKVVRIVRD